MSATSTPTLDMLPTMRDAAARITKDAQENLAGIDVVSVGPLFVESVPGGFQYSIVAIVPDFPIVTPRTLRRALCCSTSRIIHLWPQSTGRL